MECIAPRLKFFIAAGSFNVISCLCFYALNIKLKKYYITKEKMDYRFDEFSNCNIYNLIMASAIATTNFIIAYMIFQ